MTAVSALKHPFENDNARYLDPEQIAKTFVPLNSFWSLFSQKNHILLGTRGSGKTVIGKMLSHDHLSLLQHPRAIEIVKDKEYIGCYAQARLNWVSGLHSQSTMELDNKSQHFILRFNFVLAQAFISTLRSLLQAFPEKDKPNKEFEAVNRILSIWSGDVQPPQQVYSFKDLNALIADVDFRLQRRNVGLHYGLKKPAQSWDLAIAESFASGIGQPIFVLRDSISSIFELPASSKFLIAIDEMEFLLPEHHCILNGLLRADTPGFIFKFITAPYMHHTLETGTFAPLNEGHDFEYMHMDHNRIVDLDGIKFDLNSIDRRFLFATALFVKRANASGVKVDATHLERLLGRSKILDSKAFKGQDLEHFFLLAARHSNEKTQKRIINKFNQFRTQSNLQKKRVLGNELSNEITRKIKPGILIRENVRNTVGARKGDVYSGLSMVISCTDSNPRLLIRTFNMLFPELEKQVKKKNPLVNPATQNEVLEIISERFWGTIHSLPDHGPKIAKLIDRLGSFFHDKLHVELLGTDIVGSVSVDEDASYEFELIKQAVAWGFMYPHFKDEHTPALPTKGGEFRLAYTLAPKFQILPRRGRSIKIHSIKSMSDEQEHADFFA